MRSRLTLVLVALSLPVAELAAQRVRLPLIGRRGPTPERPAEKPPQAPGIPDAMAYNRYRLTRFSLEQYPMLSYMSTGYFGARQNYTAFGDGMHLGFRVAPSLFVTADMTSLVVGAPFSLGTGELGLRLKPWTSPRFTPIVDVRRSWAYTVGQTGLGASVVPAVFLARAMYGDVTTSSGHGNILGLGAETRIRPQLSLTSTLSTTRYSMVTRDLRTRSEASYTTDITRLTVGLKYNHGRWLDPH